MSDKAEDKFIIEIEKAENKGFVTDEDINILSDLFADYCEEKNPILIKKDNRSSFKLGLIFGCKIYMKK